jgi:hypothetical protein
LEEEDDGLASEGRGFRGLVSLLRTLAGLRCGREAERESAALREPVSAGFLREPLPARRGGAAEAFSRACSRARLVGVSQ